MQQVCFRFPLVFALVVYLNKSIKPFSEVKGEGGVPWVQIMENELEYLDDRGGHGGHLVEKFVKKYCS